MGLNIYFCDICATRVTDADLRSGHGLLQGDDAICAACIDQPRGRAWIADHRLSIPRGIVPAASVVATGVAEVPAGVVMDLSGAAAGMAAMNTPRPEERPISDAFPVAVPTESPSGTRVAVPERRQSDIDDLPAAPYHPPETDEESSALIEVPPAVREAAGVASTETSLPAGDLRPPRGKRGSDSALRKPPSRAVAKDGGKDGKGGSPVRSSGGGNAAKSTSTRSAARSGRSESSGGGIPLQLKISLVTLPIILAVAGVGYYMRPSPAPRTQAVKDMNDNEKALRRHLDEVRQAVNNAVTSTSIDEKRKANQQWQAFLQEWEDFAADARRTSGWSEESCNIKWDELRAADIAARTKLLRDDIVRLQSQAGGK